MPTVIRDEMLIVGSIVKVVMMKIGAVVLSLVSHVDGVVQNINISR